MTVKAKVAEDSKLECEKLVENKTTMRSRTEKTTFFDPMAVTWMEKYNDKIDKIWSTLPTFIRTSIATCAIVLLGSTIRGKQFNTIPTKTRDHLSRFSNEVFFTEKYSFIRVLKKHD